MVTNINGDSLQVRLYTTLGCHLCDQAYALLEQAGLRVESVEVADDDALLERYGLRIPVVAWGSGATLKDELNWPFDATQLAGWLERL